MEGLVSSLIQRFEWPSRLANFFSEDVNDFVNYRKCNNSNPKLKLFLLKMSFVLFFQLRISLPQPISEIKQCFLNHCNSHSMHYKKSIKTDSLHPGVQLHRFYHNFSYLSWDPLEAETIYLLRALLNTSR